ncbi:MAG: hypothetical protein R3A48_13170 [Polyangiales bacterium]
MTDELRERLAAHITEHLRAHPLDGVSLLLGAVDPIEGGLRACFVTDQPMSSASLRLPGVVNDALRAALGAVPEARGQRIEVRVDTEV